MRVLIAARLSQLTDHETGLDSQEQEVARWCEARGYEIVDVVADHKTGKSSLWERPNLKPWVTETSLLARYDALACLKVDRLTRAEKQGTIALEKWAHDNGKEILITSADVQFPSEGVDGIRWDLYIRMAHQEWLDIQERYARMVKSRHDKDSLVGKAPWGYEVVMLSPGIKTLEPTTEGRIWVPKILGMLAEGMTPRQVGEYLEANGIKAAGGGRWHESRIIAMARRSTYAGYRPRKGLSALEIEPLVSRALLDKASAMVESRARHGRETNTAPKALLSKLMCGNPDCEGEGTWPMYRTKGTHYRCSGKGAMRKGCGAPMLLCSDVDNLVLGASEYWDSQEYVTQRFIPGNEAGAELEQLRSQMAEALRLAPSDQLTTIMADYLPKITELEAQGNTQPHWENVHTGETEGEHLQGLNVDGQRDYLAHKNILAWKDSEGRTCVTIDGALARTGGPSAIADEVDKL